MLEFATEKGTKLYYDVYYELGGYSYLTGKTIPRAYMLVVQRERNSFTAFSGLDSPSGSIITALLKVGRKNKKQEANANNMVTEEFLQDIADRYGV